MRGLSKRRSNWLDFLGLISEENKMDTYGNQQQSSYLGSGTASSPMINGPTINGQIEVLQNIVEEYSQCVNDLSCTADNFRGGVPEKCADPSRLPSIGMVGSLADIIVGLQFQLGRFRE